MKSAPKSITSGVPWNATFAVASYTGLRVNRKISTVTIAAQRLMRTEVLLRRATSRMDRGLSERSSASSSRSNCSSVGIAGLLSPKAGGPAGPYAGAHVPHGQTAATPAEIPCGVASQNDTPDTTLTGSQRARSSGPPRPPCPREGAPGRSGELQRARQRAEGSGLPTPAQGSAGGPQIREGPVRPGSRVPFRGGLVRLGVAAWVGPACAPVFEFVPRGHPARALSSASRLPDSATTPLFKGRAGLGSLPWRHVGVPPSPCLFTGRAQVAEVPGLPKY